MPKALYIDPNETLRPKDHELELPKIPVMKYNKTVKEELKEGNFIAAFSFFWNSWASMIPNLKLIVCG